MSKGVKILDGLRAAIKGDFSAVTIEGQRWVRAPEWQPIETAPKDGTIIILGNPHYKAGRAAYYGLALRSVAAGATKAFPWVFLDETNGVNQLNEQWATCWMPLPAPHSP